MVDVDLVEDDYKIIISWYELAFAGKDIIGEKDLECMHKLLIMCKALIRENKQFSSHNEKDD